MEGDMDSMDGGEKARRRQDSDEMATRISKKGRNGTKATYN